MTLLNGMNWKTRPEDRRTDVFAWYRGLTTKQQLRVHAWLEKNPPDAALARAPELGQSPLYLKLAWAYIEMPEFVIGPADRDRTWLEKAAAWYVGGAPWGA